MGAWGVGSFENDDASDWILDFMETPDPLEIGKALTTVLALPEDEYLEITEAANAVAAAELVAALRGKPNPDLPPEAADWVAEQGNVQTDHLSNVALQSLSRVKRNSELRDCWLDTNNAKAWEEAISDLETRISAPPPEYELVVSTGDISRIHLERL